MNTFRILYLIFGIFILFSSLSMAQQSNSIEIASVKIVEELVLGKNNIQSLNESFGRIKDVAVGQEGTIYVADEGSMNIKVFNKTGDYIGSIGRRGRGPGEFLSLREITISNKNKLVVVDIRQFRISKFNKDGEILDTYLMSKKSQDVVFFNQIWQLKDNKNLVLAKKFGRNYNDDSIFHIWDQNFENELNKFGSFKSLGFNEGFSVKIASMAVGSFTFLNDNQLIFAPSIYSGKLFTFKKKNGQWQEGIEINGHNFEIPSYKNFSKGTGPEKAPTLHTPEGEFKGFIYVSSMGVFRLENGNVAHFSIKTPALNTDKEKWILGVELFDQSNNYLGYHELDSIPVSMDNLIKPQIKAKDQKDHFYMISHKNGIPVVRVFTLDIQEN